MKPGIYQRWIIAGPVALLLCLAVSGCRKPGESAKNKGKDAKETAVPVEVTAVARGPIEETYSTSTHLEAEEEVKVFARTSNRVTELLVEEGDRVDKGKLLLRLDNDIQKTQFAKAEAKLQKARLEFERQKTLFDQKLISEQAFLDAQFELRQLELALDDARRELDYTEVRAPITGTISRRLIKYGDLVNLNQHLFDVVDFNSIVARIYVPDDRLDKLSVDLLARMKTTALKNQEFKGYVKRVAPVVESKSGLVKVTIGFKDIGQLRPGMYVEVDLVTATRNDAILLSKRALVYDEGQIFAYRLEPGRKVQRIEVRQRLSDKMNVEPVSGFKEGDQIVIAGQTGLKDGARVRLPGDPEEDKDKDKDKDKKEGTAAKSNGPKTGS